MQNLAQVRSRVETALKLFNRHQLEVDGLLVTMEIDKHDFVPTHFNQQAHRDLEKRILEFASDKCSETDIKDAIKAVRDASVIAFIDRTIRALEPNADDHARAQRLFSFEHNDRLIAICDDEKSKIEYLLRRIFKTYRLMIEQYRYRENMSGKRNSLYGDPIFHVHAAFLRLVKEATRHSVEVSKEIAELYKKVIDIDYGESTDEMRLELSRIEIEQCVLEKDMFTAPHEVIEVAASQQETSIDALFPDVPELTSEEKLLIETDDLLRQIDESSERDAEVAENPLETTEPSGIDQSATLEPEIAAAAAEAAIVPGSESYHLVAQKVYVGTRLDAQITSVELDDEEKALAAAVEDDGYEVDDDQEVVQDGLFGDISAPKIIRRKMFADDLMIDTAFAWHRDRGFPYRDVPTAMAMLELQQLAETEGKALISTRLCYQVADTFHRHRLAAAANGMSSPLDSYHDDKKLRKAIKLELKLGGKPRIFAGGMMTLVNGTQACSNFRPGFAAYLYREHCPDNAVVLDTSTGYGGRMLGAVASQKVSKYIGIDPNVPTYEANIRMIEALHLRTLCEFELINLPAEDVDPEPLRETCDFSFTSPPYFAKEIYSTDETQSWKRYSTGEAWRDKFLRRMLKLTYDALKPGCIGIVNIADVKLKKKIYPLADWTRELGVEVGFTYLDTEKFPMMTRFGKGMADEVAFEPVIIFKKEVKEDA